MSSTDHQHQTGPPDGPLYLGYQCSTQGGPSDHITLLVPSNIATLHIQNDVQPFAQVDVALRGSNVYDYKANWPDRVQLGLCRCSVGMHFSPLQTS